MKNGPRGASLRALLLIAILLPFLASCTLSQVIKEGLHSLKQNARGNYYLDKRKYKDGIVAFQKELEANPESAEAQYFMGRFHLADNRPKEALYHLKRAAKLFPEKADYHFWLGMAYAANNEGDLERKSYVRALQLDNKHFQAMTYLGHNQFERSEYEKALKTYNRVLELRPHNPSALFNRALILKRFDRTPEEELAWREYLDVFASGAMARQAVLNLNALGNFQYRNHLIGSRTVTLEKIYFEAFTAKIWIGSQPSLDVLGEIMKKNQGIAIHIVAYQRNNRTLAKMRAKSVKRYLIKKFPEIKSSRLMVSWFGTPEEIKTAKKTFTEDESINFITAIRESKGMKSASPRKD